MSTKGRAGPIIPMQAEEDLAAQRIVAMGTSDLEVAYAADAASFLVGVTDRPAKSGEPVDVWIAGVVSVAYGGAVVRGALLTSDDEGQAVATTTANNRIVGIALRSGADGDLGLMVIAQGIV